MEEIEKIILAISEVTGLSKHTILHGKTAECKSAREILCYIALKDRYGITWTLMELLGWRKSQVFFAVDNCLNDLEESIDFIYLMNNVRKQLGLSAIMTEKIDRVKEEQKRKEAEIAKMRSVENSKRLFGITYTKEDGINMNNAMRSAEIYIRKYSTIGRQPYHLVRQHY